MQDDRWFQKKKKNEKDNTHEQILNTELRKCLMNRI